MRRLLLAFSLLALSGIGAAARGGAPQQVPLPKPRSQGDVSVEEALSKRRSIRDYAPDPLQLEDVAQILWSAQGLTHADGYRTAPSAGALYPIEVYLVAGDVSGLPPGVYRYRPGPHDLVPVKNGDMRRKLFSAALRQECVRDAPAVLVIAGVQERTAGKYGERARRYVLMEVGHVAQNVYLQAEAGDLATVIVGAFEDEDVRKLLDLDADHEPLALMPLGYGR